jgi:hypothetical protein
MPKFATTLLAPNDTPSLTGDAKGVTALAGDNDTSLATTAFVQTAIGSVAAGSGSIRYDTVQTLTTPQQAVALQNIAASHFNLINGKLVESHASNAATFAVKGLDGNDPSATNPVFCVMPDYTVLILTAALSLTIPSASTLGTRNGQPFRLWFALSSTGGTPKLVVRKCSDFVTMSTANGHGDIVGFPAIGIISTTALPGSAALTSYSDAAFSAFYRVIAFADYDSGLATAGTWNASPTRILPVGPKTPLPGETIQTRTFNKGQYSTASNVWQNTGLQVSLTPTCICNLIYVRADFDTQVPSSSTQIENILFRNNNTLPICILQIGAYTNAGVASYTSSGLSLQGVDAPFTVASTAYFLGAAASVNGNTINSPFQAGCILASELMG